MIMPTLDHRDHNRCERIQKTSKMKSTKYYTNKYGKTESQKLCTGNDMIYNTKANKGDLVTFISDKMNSVISPSMVEDTIISENDHHQSSDGMVSSYRRMISKWFMKPIVGDNGDSIEPGFENEAIVASVLNRYVTWISGKKISAKSVNMRLVVNEEICVCRKSPGGFI